MNAKKPNADERSYEPADCCSVAVVYEDTLIQDLAIRLCGHLLARFGNELNLQYTWWNFRFLRDPEVAQLAKEAILEVDVIVFVVHAGSDVPLHVQHWVETWLPERRGRAGALAILIEPSKPPGRPTLADAYLKAAALQANLDYLLLEQGSGVHTRAQSGHDTSFIPSGWDPFSAAAPSYSDWGIND